MGAGFDARGLRLPEIAERGAAVYEVDFAALLETKRAILPAAGVALPPSIAATDVRRYGPPPASPSASARGCARQGLDITEI